MIEIIGLTEVKIAVQKEKERNSWIHGKILRLAVQIQFGRTENSLSHSAENYKNYNYKKFRQINSLVFSLVKTFFHEIFVKEVWMTVNFRNFHTVSHQKNISSNQLFSTLYFLAKP